MCWFLLVFKFFVKLLYETTSTFHLRSIKICTSSQQSFVYYEDDKTSFAIHERENQAVPLLQSSVTGFIELFWISDSRIRDINMAPPLV